MTILKGCVVYLADRLSLASILAALDMCAELQGMTTTQRWLDALFHDLMRPVVYFQKDRHPLFQSSPRHHEWVQPSWDSLAVSGRFFSSAQIFSKEKILFRRGYEPIRGLRNAKANATTPIDRFTPNNMFLSCANDVSGGQACCIRIDGTSIRAPALTDGRLDSIGKSRPNNVPYRYMPWCRDPPLM